MPAIRHPAEALISKVQSALIVVTEDRISWS
jgi:hypothetical protein